MTSGKGERPGNVLLILGQTAPARATPGDLIGRTIFDTFSVWLKKAIRPDGLF